MNILEGVVFVVSAMLLLIGLFIFVGVSISIALMLTGRISDWLFEKFDK